MNTLLLILLTIIMLPVMAPIWILMIIWNTAEHAITGRDWEDMIWPL